MASLILYNIVSFSIEINLLLYLSADFHHNFYVWHSSIIYPEVKNNNSLNSLFGIVNGYIIYLKHPSVL